MKNVSPGSLQKARRWTVPGGGGLSIDTTPIRSCWFNGQQVQETMAKEKKTDHSTRSNPIQRTPCGQMQKAEQEQPTFKQQNRQKTRYNSVKMNLKRSAQSADGDRFEWKGKKKQIKNNQEHADTLQPPQRNRTGGSHWLPVTDAGVVSLDETRFTGGLCPWQVLSFSFSFCIFFCFFWISIIGTVATNYRYCCTWRETWIRFDFVSIWRQTRRGIAQTFFLRRRQLNQQLLNLFLVLIGRLFYLIDVLHLFRVFFFSNSKGFHWIRLDRFRWASIGSSSTFYAVKSYRSVLG